MVGEDTVKIVVAQMMFALFGGGAVGESSLRAYLSGEEKDTRTGTHIIEKPDACYAVFIWHSEKYAKIAMGTQDGYVCYEGHSNFGIGFSFSSNFGAISDFMNVGQDLVCINWPYLRNESGGHPALSIPDTEYGDDPATTEFSDPCWWACGITGSKGTASVDAYSAIPVGGGTKLHLTRGTDKWEDFHYLKNGVSLRLVVEGGAADMPAMRWKKCFLNGCYSGHYYYSVFSHGTLFYTLYECSSPFTTRAFFKAIIDGLDDNGILSDLDWYESVNDYKSFGP